MTTYKTGQWFCHRCTWGNEGKNNGKYVCSHCNNESDYANEVSVYEFQCPECGETNIENKFSSIKKCSSCDTFVLMNDIKYIQQKED